MPVEILGPNAVKFFLANLGKNRIGVKTKFISFSWTKVFELLLIRIIKFHSLMPNKNVFVFKYLLFFEHQMILLKKEPATRELFLFKSAPPQISVLLMMQERY